jgi:hypothetical protein
MNGDIKKGNVVCIWDDFAAESPYKVVSSGWGIALIKDLQTGFQKSEKLENLWKPKHLNCMVLA